PVISRQADDRSQSEQLAQLLVNAGVEVQRLGCFWRELVLHEIRRAQVKEVRKPTLNELYTSLQHIERRLTAIDERRRANQGFDSFNAVDGASHLVRFFGRERDPARLDQPAGE